MANRHRPGFEPFTSGGSSYSQLYPTQPSRYHSGTPDLRTIGEDREEDFADNRPFAKPSARITEFPAEPFARSPSIFRRISTSIRQGGTGPRTRPPERGQYANIHESPNDHIPVDLSSLEGLGIELKVLSQTETAASPAGNENNTSYIGASDYADAYHPRGKRRKTLGYGLSNEAFIDRSSSVRIQQPTLQRAQTVRQVSQTIADERGQIVACDLTSLEGTGLRERRSTKFDEMTDESTIAVPQDKQSYFIPTDPDVPDWKPFSMRAPYILMLAFIAFGLAGFEEYLCQTSIRKQNQTPKSALLHFNNVDQVSIPKFFVWKYLPTMITIFYATLFSIMDFNVRRLEPYYQLSQPQGAPAAASLTLDHLTMFQYIVPFNSARLRQWAVFSSSLANILAATIAPAIQNASVQFEQNAECEQECKNKDIETKFWVVIEPNWSRALTATYGLVGLILIFLYFQLRRKSGLLSNPKGIAGIASMATKSHILRDFDGLDQAARGKIHKKLSHRTYVLYKSTIWQGQFISTPDANDVRDSARRLRSPHPTMLRLTAGIPFILLMTFCLAMVPAISVTKLNFIPNTVSWLPVLVATFLKLIWSTFEADVRLMEPFYRLYKGHCTAKNSLTLDYQSTVYAWMPIRALLNGHYLVALVGACSVFLDILSVTIGSFSVDSGAFMHYNGGIGNEDETFISFWVSMGLSCAILIYAILVASLVYWRRRKPFLPREPNTIAAVLSFIYSSKMLNDFFDTELLNGHEMEARLMGIGKKYAFGWFRGRDGKVHCAIDEEPLLSKYQQGVPYNYDDAVSGPMQGHDGFYGP